MVVPNRSPLKGDATSPDCVAAALRFEHQLEQWTINKGKKRVPHAFVGAVAVSALTEEYMHLNDPRLPLGEQRIARETMSTSTWTTRSLSSSGKVSAADTLDLPGGYSEGRFVMSGASHLWQALSTWKGDVPFDVHSSNFRLDKYFGKPGITLSSALDATRSVVVKNSLGNPVGSLIVYRAPLLILLKLDAQPRAAHPIHKDLRDLRLLVEGYSYHNQTLKPREENPFELDRERFRHFLDQLKMEEYEHFYTKVQNLVADKKIAKEVAEWELLDEQGKEQNSRKTYEAGDSAMYIRYRDTFRFLRDRFEWTRHHPTFAQRKAASEVAHRQAQQQRSLAKASPYEPVPRSLYRTAL
ncbi:hypothetical protein JCM11251_002388 [Rhodosporidiobolus azoricus]